MRVLFVVTAYPRFQGDVITPWLVELLTRLQKKGIEVSVFTSSYKGLRDQFLDDIKVYRFRYFFKKYERLTHEETVVDRIGRGLFNIILTFSYVIFGALSISCLTRKKKFDIIHVHWPFPHILFGILGKRFGQARLFSSFYGVEIRWLKKKFPLLIKSFSVFVNKSDTVTAISTHTANELKNIVNKDIKIIPFSAAMAEKIGKGTSKNEIIFVGRLVERKGVKYLIETFDKIKDDIPHRLIIIGDGPERTALEKLTISFGLQNRVEFKGKISDHDLNRYYQSCSFLVLPAVYDRKGDTEGLGVVLLEAMSYSKPVIASGVGGITDIVVDRVNGLLVPPADPQALADAIKMMVNNNSLRKKLGIEAKNTVDGKFNWNTITDKLISSYLQGYDRK